MRMSGTVLLSGVILFAVAAPAAGHGEERIPPSELLVPTKRGDNQVTDIVLTAKPARIDGVVRGQTGPADIDLAITSQGSTNHMTVTTDDGTFTVPTGSGRTRVTASIDGVTRSAQVQQHPQLSAKIQVEPTASQGHSPVRITVTDPSDAHSPVVGADITVTVREPVGQSLVRSLVTGPNGVAQTQVPVWRNPKLTAVAAVGAVRITTVTTIPTIPSAPVAHAPADSPQPRRQFPLTARPSSKRADARVARIPNRTWRAMRGLSWRPGCTPRGQLRLITVNYLGFDGYRHRGELVASRKIARRAAALLSRLHNLGFPIRQMRLVDAYGKNAGNRPGANDYKSMAADNTSAFNCRYVVGKERQRVRSPHASGRSIDINPWENPYVARNGVFPNSYFLRRPASSGVFTSGSRALAVTRRLGCRWGGGFADYHHFDC